MTKSIAKAIELTEYIIGAIERKRRAHNGSSPFRFYMAISGGSSPLILFDLWAGEYKDRIDWGSIEIFWVDERAVPKESPESNFGIAYKRFISPLNLDMTKVHPIDGSADPEIESEAYSNLVREIVPSITTKDGAFPLFDLVILGIGADGHIASIFPDRMDLLEDSKWYSTSVNSSGQRRVTMTGKTIMSATDIIFYLRGIDKQGILNSIAVDGAERSFPAAYISKRSTHSKVFYDL